MEAASFFFSIVTVLPLFTNACDVWSRIRAAENFGQDVVEYMRKLETEFYHFYTWNVALETLSLKSAPGTSPKALPSQGSGLVERLSTQPTNPIVNATRSILDDLVAIEKVFRDLGLLNSVIPQPTSDVGDSIRVLEAVSAASAQSQRRARRIQSLIPWISRIKYQTAPWRQSDQSLLREKLEDIAYWNATLYASLPGDLKDSILRQGVLSSMVIDPSKVDALVGLGRGAVKAHGELFLAARRLLEINPVELSRQDRNSIIAQALLGPSEFTLDQNRPSTAFSLVEYTGDTKEVVLVEWYSYDGIQPTSNPASSFQVSRLRIAAISQLLTECKKPSTLNTLACRGMVEVDEYNAWGLVSQIPSNYANSKPPVLLHHLLSKKRLPGSSLPYRLPKISERFAMASSLASSLYTLIMARWHHKQFNSLMVVFFFHVADDEAIDFSNPFLSGFNVSRPSGQEEISILGKTTTDQERYLHPDLRRDATDPQGERPRFNFKYEIYSFGLLLAEIGFWSPITRLAGRTSSGRAESSLTFKDELTQKCETDLACWMGEQYRDIVVWCLKAADSPGDHLTEASDFYWDVVLKLVYYAAVAKSLSVS